MPHSGRRLFAALACVTLLLTTVSTTADTPDFPEQPILRLNTQRHTVMINRIAVDRAERYVVTASDDKTAKVWDVETGRLLQTLRVPQAEGDVGKLYAAAISPDGETVAVGGWTGYKRWGGHSIFLFDRASGTLRQRIAGLPNVILHLAWSGDGRYLAATGGTGAGLHIYDGRNFHELARNRDCGERSHWADFDRDNRLLVSCDDDYLRLYDSDFQLLTERRAPGGKRPFAVAFSPDGRRVAVGYDDSTRVDLLDGADLRPLKKAADTAGVDNGDLSKVAWSADGHRLLAAGRYDDGGSSPVRRWDKGGLGTWREFAVAQNTVMGLLPLRDGRLLLGAADPLLALLDAEDQPLWKQGRAVADFRGQLGERGIHLSRRGELLQFGFEDWGKSPAHFSLARAELRPGATDSTDTASDALAPPRSDGLPISDWEDEYHPKLDGQPLSLDQYEFSRSLAIAPNGKYFLLGTSWWLRYFDAAGKQQWQKPVPGAAWAVNISGDGHVAVAGFGDGTLRWYRTSDGEELLALFAEPPEADGDADNPLRWVLWTPQGYYRASAGGEELIGWHVNNGADKAPDFYPADRFREQFYRPDVIARVLDELDVDKALAKADKARGTATVKASPLELRPPVIRITDPSRSEPQRDQKLVLLYEAESATAPIEKIQVRVNGRQAKLLAEHKPRFSRDRLFVQGRVEIEVPPENANVELLASNRHSTSVPARYVVNWQGGEDWRKPRLFVLAVGVSRYADEAYKLNYAAKDAEDFVAAIRQQKGRLYRDVQVRLLPDAEASRNAVLDGLEWLELNTGARDVAMLFMSGHGSQDSHGRYRFLPHDYNPLREKRSTITDATLQEFLSAVPGKVVAFLDTCHSGGAGGTKAPSQPDMIRLANELADADSGVVVFSSSTGKQYSLEDDAWRNGAFTEALVAGIEGQADFTKDWFVSMAELEVFVGDHVQELTGGRQTPTVTKPKAVQDFKMIHVQKGN